MNRSLCLWRLYNGGNYCTKHKQELDEKSAKVLITQLEHMRTLSLSALDSGARTMLKKIELAQSHVHFSNKLNEQTQSPNNERSKTQL
jgi:hypothetical protein